MVQNLKLPARLLLVGLMLLWLARVFSPDIIETLVPAIALEMTSFDDNLSIVSLEVNRDGRRATLRLRGNLLRTLYYKDKVIRPIPASQGWYQIDINVHALLVPALIFLGAILAWPERSFKESCLRLLIAIPALAALFAVDVPLDVLGNFQQALIRDADPLGSRPLYVWDRFLDGGGGGTLGLVFAVITIALAVGKKSVAQGIR